MFDIFDKNKLPDIKLRENKPKAVIEYDLERKIKNGYNWFYWIAGLSVINTIMFSLFIIILFILLRGIRSFSLILQ